MFRFPNCADKHRQNVNVSAHVPSHLRQFSMRRSCFFSAKSVHEIRSNCDSFRMNSIAITEPLHCFLLWYCNVTISLIEHNSSESTVWYECRRKIPSTKNYDWLQFWWRGGAHLTANIGQNWSFITVVVFFVFLTQMTILSELSTIKNSVESQTQPKLEEWASWLNWLAIWNISNFQSKSNNPIQIN